MAEVRIMAQTEETHACAYANPAVRYAKKW